MGLNKADIIISGWNGKMGRTLRNLVPNYFSGNLYDWKQLPTKPTSPLVWIDFSHANCFDSVIENVRTLRCPLIMGTTGLTEENHHQLRILSQQVPVVYDTNFSVGIHILRKLLQNLPQNCTDFDISIFESHHASKKDAPSGTAKTLANDIKTHFKLAKDVSILSHRGGGIRGKHSIIFAGQNEVITLQHEALDRSVFAEGALKAAQWCLGKTNGLFSMKDLLS